MIIIYLTFTVNFSRNRCLKSVENWFAISSPLIGREGGALQLLQIGSYCRIALSSRKAQLLGYSTIEAGQPQCVNVNTVRDLTIAIIELSGLGAGSRPRAAAVEGPRQDSFATIAVPFAL